MDYEEYFAYEDALEVFGEELTLYRKAHSKLVITIDHLNHLRVLTTKLFNKWLFNGITCTKLEYANSRSLTSIKFYTQKLSKVDLKSKYSTIEDWSEKEFYEHNIYGFCYPNYKKDIKDFCKEYAELILLDGILGKYRTKWKKTDLYNHWKHELPDCMLNFCQTILISELDLISQLLGD